MLRALALAVALVAGCAPASESAIPSPSPTEEPSPTATASPSPSPSPTASPSPTPAPAPAGLLTVDWVARAYPGSYDISVCVVIENTSESVSISYSEFQFSAIDGENFVYPFNASYPMRLSPLMSGQLSPGQKARGEVMFHVPPDVVLTGLVWNVGFEATPEISVGLPTALTFYSSNSSC